VRAWLLGSGGWIPTERRATACTLVRDGERGLAVDAGTGIGRLVTQPALLAGVTSLDVVLTHFHLDHVCGLAYVPALPVRPTIWAPGAWLYGEPSDALLGPLRRSPLSPSDASDLGAICELRAGRQRIGGFAVETRAQERHWAPTAGIRVGDDLAVVTDTAYEPESAAFAAGVGHLLHEAWSPSARPESAEGDATAAEAGEVARAAGARRLTLIHLHPRLADSDELLADARSRFPQAELGRDGVELALGP
jgi:ribonuclease BN (tRNA processing enzyme)